MTHDAEPAMTHDAEPAMTHDAEPAMTHDAEPAMTHDAEPAMTHDAEPAMTHDAAGHDPRRRAGTSHSTVAMTHDAELAGQRERARHDFVSPDRGRTCRWDVWSGHRGRTHWQFWARLGRHAYARACRLSRPVWLARRREHGGTDSVLPV